MIKIQTILSWAKTIFSYNRSLTGEGVRKTLNFFKKINPELKILSFKSGSKCFDWTVPEEWEIKNAYIEDAITKKRYANFKKNNLHLVSYSIPIKKTVSFNELKKHIFTLPKQPKFIPYVTSYYKKNWGFCLSHNEFKKLKKNKYKVFIDSKFKKGLMNYAELYLKGKTDKEIFFSTNICHPSMANNELSGPLLANYIYKVLKESKVKTRFSYRFLFIPETIGSIAYLSKNYLNMKRKIIAGFVLSCVGDDRGYSYIQSREGNNLADKALKAAFINLKKGKEYSFLERGSDERQYCYPGIDLPVAGFCRSKYDEYKEYHSSADNLDLISSKGFEGAYKVLKTIIDTFEIGIFPKVKFKCEPQLSKRKLYSSTSQKSKYNDRAVKRRMNILAYCDGNRDIFEIANTINEPLEEVTLEIKNLQAEGLINFKR